MRVANIFEEGKLGGPQIYIIRLASGLRGKVDMTLIIPDENSDSFRARCDAAGLQYKIIKMSRITKEWKVAIRYLLLFPWEIIHLTKLIRKGNYDVVYICGGSWQYKGAIAGKMAGKKVLWHLNDTCMPWLFRKIFSILSPLADGYVYASERTKSYYGPLVKKDKPAFIIPAPVDTIEFDSTQKCSGDEDLIRQLEGKIVIGTVANINPIKGLETFIRMVASMNVKYSNLVFLVIGPVYESQQRYFESLMKLCETLDVENIEFVGSRDDIRPLVRRFDLYVCSSLAESSPISVWEALSMGKPVVSTDVGDVPLYVRNNYNGFIADVGDSEALSRRLGQLVNDEKLGKEFGYRSREVAISKLDIQHCVKRHLDAYACVTDCACNSK